MVKPRCQVIPTTIVYSADAYELGFLWTCRKQCGDNFAYVRGEVSIYINQRVGSNQLCSAKNVLYTRSLVRAVAFDSILVSQRCIHFACVRLLARGVGLTKNASRYLVTNMRMYDENNTPPYDVDLNVILVPTTHNIRQ